jgi:uncharacterized membrane protein
MNLAHISALGWLHTLACLIALPLGFAQLLLAKGTERHVLIGRGYLIAMVLATTTPLALPSHFPVRGVGFDLFHWGAVLTFVILLIGYVAAARQRASLWAYLHPSAMLCSYYLLIGALVNELFVRVDILRKLAFAGAADVVLLRSRLLGLTHSVVLLLFLAIWFCILVGVSKSRRGHRTDGLRQPSVP